MSFDMAGKKCSLIGGKCPGDFVGGDKYGCPHWREMVIEIEGKSEPDIWRGCGILMDPHLTVGITKAVNGAARQMQGVRNVVARGFMGMALAARIDPTPLMAEFAQADKDTNEKRDSLLLEPINGHRS
jgi:hypothetical protein